MEQPWEEPHWKKRSKEVISTFFIANVPEGWVNRQLWRCFQSVGKMRDAFIPYKKGRSGSSFAFIRFADVEEVKGFLVVLNAVEIGDRKAKVFVANNSRNFTVRGGRVLDLRQPPVMSNADMNGRMMNCMGGDKGGVNVQACRVEGDSGGPRSQPLSAGTRLESRLVVADSVSVSARKGWSEFSDTESLNFIYDGGDDEIQEACEGADISGEGDGMEFVPPAEGEEMNGNDGEMVSRNFGIEDGLFLPRMGKQGGKSHVDLAAASHVGSNDSNNHSLEEEQSMFEGGGDFKNPLKNGPIQIKNDGLRSVGSTQKVVAECDKGGGAKTSSESLDLNRSMLNKSSVLPVKIPNIVASSTPVIKSKKSKRNPIHSLKMKDTLWVRKSRILNPDHGLSFNRSRTSSIEEEVQNTVKVGVDIGYGRSELLSKMISGIGATKNGRISGLMIDGEWEVDPIAIKLELFQQFTSRFREDDYLRPRFRSSGFKQLSESDAESLILPFSGAEIKGAVWDCGGDKAPNDTMEQMGFPVRWREWVWEGLSSARSSVLVNGSPTKEFGASRGLRQGDPLSPFLFILVMEALHLSIFEAVNMGIFHGIKLPNDGPVISHLFYADDAIFLGEWSLSNVQNLGRILKCFHVASGLKINFNKSSLFGVNVDSLDVELAVGVLNCQTGKLPFPHLGIPIGENMARVKSWKPVVDRFTSKLSSWKARSLSFGGRLTLVKAVLGSLPLFFFSMFKAPVQVVNKLESIRRGFLWGGSESSPGISWVKWDIVIAPKDAGGLGVGSLRDANLALLAKWRWRLKASRDDLWVKVVSAIHGLVGDGLQLRFWVDCWLTDAPLMEMLPLLFSLEKNKRCLVADRVNKVGETVNWNWEWKRRLRTQTELQLLDHLKGLVAAYSFGSGEDKWGWFGDDSEYGKLRKQSNGSRTIDSSKSPIELKVQE
ncbi:hypothetical protein QVD17_09785 [Tagetes erecta]|uniref:RRM domain-containing protein n=1 Tax=Tagetes erecta TaxID=13708 RepID=A0AAD8L1K3_TARER|nr:hypothetical protein QVD17_09785 [Tagetes erecta]